jgi:broad specificity phosphatase PhoE
MRLILFLFAWTLFAAPDSVILLRHAERESSATDSLLSEQGRRRAEGLVKVLKDANVKAILTSEVQRAKDTATPLATALKITPKVVQAQDYAEFRKLIMAEKSGSVLVIGHSNTLPEIIKALGGPAVTIDETEFDKMFILSLPKASLLIVHY